MNYENKHFCFYISKDTVQYVFMIITCCTNFTWSLKGGASSRTRVLIIRVWQIYCSVLWWRAEEVQTCVCLSQSADSVLNGAKRTAFENKDMISERMDVLRVVATARLACCWWTFYLWFNGRCACFARFALKKKLKNTKRKQVCFAFEGKAEKTFHSTKASPQLIQYTPNNTVSLVLLQTWQYLFYNYPALVQLTLASYILHSIIIIFLY